MLCKFQRIKRIISWLLSIQVLVVLSCRVYLVIHTIVNEVVSIISRGRHMHSGGNVILLFIVNSVSNFLEWNNAIQLNRVFLDVFLSCFLLIKVIISRKIYFWTHEMSSRLYLAQFSLKLIIRNILFEPKEALIQDLSHEFSYDIKMLANYIATHRIICFVSLNMII